MEDLGKTEVKKKLKGKRLLPKLVLEEAEEAQDVDAVVEDAEEEDLGILLPESINITPAKKRRTKKQRERKIAVNPPGKRKTRKILPESVEILEQEHN
jgi:hypothetical protein